MFGNALTGFFLGALAKLQKVTNSVVYVCPSALNNSTSTGRIFVKIDITEYFSKICRENEVALQSDQNNGYFT